MIKQSKKTERGRQKVRGGSRNTQASVTMVTAVDEADLLGCSLWDCEPLEPQIHVDVTELGERRGRKG